MNRQRKKILAISGSTRKDSVNMYILRAIAGMYASVVDIPIFEGIDMLPHFNPDLDKEPFPAQVVLFRKQIAEADGVLICTPEYVYSLPGSLKNAVEWTVSTTLFTNKPAALITAASSGQKAKEALDILMAILGVQQAAPSLLIQAPKNKINAGGTITDPATVLEIRSLMDAFITHLARI